MSFALLPTLFAVGGIALLAAFLWLIQRLRVQHRDVEVLSTLFWQAATEETRARVFVRRFRHWPAWLLLVAIASLLWMLMAQPRVDSFSGQQHVILVDWSVDNTQTREMDLRLAIDRASTLPPMAREIVAVGNHMETLLAAGEPVELAFVRSDGNTSIGPQGIGWAIESLSARANEAQPLTLHVVGDVVLDQDFFNALSEHATLRHISRDSPTPQIGLRTLGIASATSGRWDAVDVWFEFDGTSSLDAGKVAVMVGQSPITSPVVRRGDKSFQLTDVDAEGDVLVVQYDGQELGGITLPIQERIRVSLDPDTPDSLRHLVAVDDACQIVESGGEVRIGVGDECNLRLSESDQAAFQIESNGEDPQATLNELVDELALRQIDATSIANQSGQMIDVQVETSEMRRIAVWRSLFTSAFDFQESRACPIFVSRSIRWIADRPPLVPFAQQGRRLPVAAQAFDRAVDSVALTSDGRELRTVRIVPDIKQIPKVDPSSRPGLFWQLSLYSWFGLIVAALLVGEWVLYQRGRMP